MRPVFILILATLLIVKVSAQQSPKPATGKVNFRSMISRLKKKGHISDTAQPPLIYKGRSFSIETNKNPINFEIKRIRQKKLWKNNYHVLSTVIYKDRLIVSDRGGKLICYSVSTFERDPDFEKTLNTIHFSYHWIIDDKLIALSGNKYVYLDEENKWANDDKAFLLQLQPKLFEDERYLAFGDCHGEWGGTIYFYNKQTQKTYFTEATCANSIVKKDGKYEVLSTLAHLHGTAGVKRIADPDKLTPLGEHRINQTSGGYALGRSDSSNAAADIFDYYDILMYSSFTYEGRTLYLINWNDETFLAEIENKVIKIVNPLFNKELRMASSTTNTYNNTILINFSRYNTRSELEMCCIVIKDGKLVLVEWE